MRIAISGSSGLVGTRLAADLRQSGHEIIPIVRRPVTGGAAAVYWNTATAQIEWNVGEKIDAVIHLAGENIAGRWTRDKKRKIRESRVHGTRQLCDSLVRLANPPETLIAASAIGFYGDRGDEVQDEGSPAGRGFLSSVCVEWEAEAARAASIGIRVVNLRIGIVLSARGGALRKMLPAFRMGFGGPVGSGRQYMSWISLDDLSGVVAKCIQVRSLAGPVNAVAPNPVRNSEFATTLGRALGRPAFVSLPAFAARFALGEAADELLLNSTRVEPTKLLKAGHSFRHPTIHEALRAVLNEA